MVDVEERLRLSHDLRRFASGRLTVDRFEALWDDAEDDASSAFFLYAWAHYDDFRTVRLEGKWRLTPAARRRWARWALYLAIDESPYPWEPLPVFDWREALLFRFLRRLVGCPRSFDDRPTGIEAKHWPFRDEAHLREAERIHLARYLA